MFLEQLKTINFRNLRDQSINTHRRFNILFGENAQGKTNLLEAVLLVGGLQSFRNGRVREMIRFGEEASSVCARIQAQGMTRQMEVRLHQRGRRMRVDGKAARKTVDYLSGLGVTTFTPEELVVPRGSPGPRRRLLDRAVTSVWPAFSTLSRDYSKVLASRNKLLQQLGPRASSSTAGKQGQLLDVLDGQICELGARVLAGRIRYISRISPLFCEAFTEMTRSGVKGRLVYQTCDTVGEAGDRIEQLSQALATELKATQQLDLRRGATSRGPHADDLTFTLDGHSTRSFGSQGQIRSLVLAFRMAQIRDTHAMLGYFPVLLLDDVSSELDAKRNQYLFDFIKKIECQTFLTTTRPELMQLGMEHKKFRVEDGAVSRG